MSNIKWNTESVKDKCKEFGIEFLDENYLNVEFKHTYRCACGNTFNRCWRSIIKYSNFKCDECGTKILWNIDKVRNKCIELGIEFIDKEYFKNSYLHNFKCKCGKVFQRRWSDMLINESYYCFDCLGIKEYTIEEVKLYFADLGYELISGIYKNIQEKLVFKDMEGFYYVSTFNNMKHNIPPSKFYKTNPYTIQNIKLWLKLNNKPFVLVSENYEGNKKPLKFKCLNKDCGEEFEKNWNSVINGQNCGYCAGQQVGLSNCLATKNPELAKEWHPTKNGDLTPYDVVCGTNQKVWWQCSKNPKHEWDATIHSRNDNIGCPYCSGRLASEENNLLKIYPELCKMWNYNRNKKMPFEYTPKSQQKVWWICEKGHEWEINISSFISNRENYPNSNGCPYCTGQLPSETNNLLVCNPKLCEEWDYSKNKKRPEEYCPNSGKYAWWKCRECGYEWEAIISSRNGNNRGCPECNKSKGEKRIQEFFIKHNIVFESQKEFYGLLGLKGKNLSYDFYLPDYNILVEYQGQFHDGNGNKGNQYIKQNLKTQQEHDKRKREYSKNNSISLLEIWYWDFDNIETILENNLKP